MKGRGPEWRTGDDKERGYEGRTGEGGAKGRVGNGEGVVGEVTGEEGKKG